jgi:cytochrome c553
VMGGFAATLSRQDMADLAAYYASQKGLDHKY